jgi:hypothetical protein
MKLFIHMEEVKMSNLLNRLHEFLGLTFATILTIFFCNINISLLLDELSGKLFHISL